MECPYMAYMAYWRDSGCTDSSAKDSGIDPAQSPNCLSKNCQKDSCKYKMKDEINGKKSPSVEQNSLFPQRDETSRKCRKEHESGLSCPHWPTYQYKYSESKGGCCKDMSKSNWDAFCSGREAGKMWIAEKLDHLLKNRKDLVTVQENVLLHLKATAKKPTTELILWNIGFWHGVLRLL
uniref:Uncharacterized protein n=1 Tax=Lobelia laxiflora TaxID=252775 RepID=A0A1L6BTU0_9ASTR|nr:hypothetical protein Lo_lax1Pt0115 [Lobelia laxiflora]APQ39434.1 hypothetical protein Lo_lax1Pt0115 [Lobelia laxiflora]